MSQNLTKRKDSLTEGALKEWFSDVKTFLNSKSLLDISPDRIFNLAETAFLLNPKSSKVISECYTCLIGGNAAGQLLPTMVVYNNERIPPLVVKFFPDEFVIGKSGTGCITDETFYMYIENTFYQWCLKNEIDFPVVLYLDGHNPHLTITLLDFCGQYGIELIALYPDATHLMQPMDVALFHPLRMAYTNAIDDWQTKNNGRRLTKVHFASVLKTALYSLDSKKILENGCNVCGLFPFSENGINYSKLIKMRVENQEDTSEQNTDSVTIENYIFFIESNIDSDVLRQFKNHDNSEEWTASIEHKELYNLWLRCKRYVNNALDV